jgi:uncharacterized membrane protein YcaP (DUF421 family)
MDTLYVIIGQSDGSISWWQMCVRGVLIMLLGLLLIRLFGIRAFGKQSALDILVAIIVGSNFSRALTGNAPFVPTLATTSLIVALFWLLQRLAAHWRMLALILKGNPIVLIQGGESNEAAMRSAGVTNDDIEEAARLSGVSTSQRIVVARMERNGKISTTTEC